MAPTLGEVFDVPATIAASDFVLQLQEGVQDPGRTVGDYVVTASLATAFRESLDLVDQAVKTRSDIGVFLHGDFGSGKSHFMAVLDLLLRGDPGARAITGLQEAVADHQDVLGRNLLTVEYHLVGAKSLEEALFAGYLHRVRSLHPQAQLPMLHKSDALFHDADKRRADDERAFFEALNSGGGGSSAWGGFEAGWTPQAYDAAVTAPVGDQERSRLAADLLASMFSGYARAGEWLDISEGLAEIARHAAGLGYVGLVLFLDELVLWLASRLADQAFVSEEGAKVAKLVESGVGRRAVPIVSFVARQRELQDFYADAAGGGAQRSAVGDALRYWEGRFDTIHLKAANLPQIVHRRLLSPRNAAAQGQIDAAVAGLKGNKKAWDALLRDEAGSDEAAFTQVYPFSPALVNTLVHLSGLLQRERTALRVMAQLMSEGRDTRTIDRIIPVAELFDSLVLKGDQPLTAAVKHRFELARRLYATKFRPMLLAEHGLREADTAGLDRDHPFRVDDRLAKTLLVSALVDVPALKDLTASKLAALNHGSIRAMFPGQEAATVLGRLRPWAQQIGELEVGDGPDPIIRLALSGVDYESVLALVQAEDTPGQRRGLLRRMVFDQFGVADGLNLFAEVVTDAKLWRGFQRRIDLVFGNIRDESALPDQVFTADGDTWRIMVDYPFDDAGHVPSDDLARFEQFTADGMTSRTVGWVPRFLSAARQDDLGKLVLLEYLLGGGGDQFDANATHLPVDQRAQAKTLLDNTRRALREKIGQALKQAYGVAQATDADIDTGLELPTQFPSLEPSVALQPPVGATLSDALQHLVDQMLSAQYPDHPRFDTEIRNSDLNTALEYVTRAAAAPDGRVDPVESAARSRLRRVVNPLKAGECYENHYVFTPALFPWRNDFVRLAAADDDEAVAVTTIRAHLSGRGLTREVQDLLIAAWALLDDKEYRRHGARVQVTSLREISDDLVLTNPQLPATKEWEAALAAAKALFGVAVPERRSAANLASLAAQVRARAKDAEPGCRNLMDQLQQHTATLDLSADAPRLLTAGTAAGLVGPLAKTDDDLALALELARFDLPDEPQPLAKSIASAATVGAGLKSATWGVLDAVATRATTDPAAAEVLAELRRAARGDEAHAALNPLLRQAVDRASKYLAGPLPPITHPGNRPGSPAPSPPPGTTPVTPGGAAGGQGGGSGGATTFPGAPPASVNEVHLQGVDDALERRLADISGEIAKELRSNPGRSVKITWWLE